MPNAEPIKFVIPGAPIAKKRPRFANRRTKSGATYVAAINDQETEEGRFLLGIRTQNNGRPAITDPIILTMYFDLPVPKSTSRKKVAAMLAGNILPAKKPDLDNLIKFPLDVMNGEIWADDSQVVTIKALKRYAEVPKTTIYISIYSSDGEIRAENEPAASPA